MHDCPSFAYFLSTPEGDLQCAQISLLERAHPVICSWHLHAPSPILLLRPQSCNPESDKSVCASACWFRHSAARMTWSESLVSLPRCCDVSNVQIHSLRSGTAASLPLRRSATVGKRRLVFSAGGGIYSERAGATAWEEMESGGRGRGEEIKW